VRAEEEYRQVILQYPDNQKMVAEAKKKLLQVQEVIAEREYRVGRFYFMRQTYPAAIARLQSLVDRYPLYSKADETLYLLGQSYEGEIAVLRKMDALDRQRKVNEAQLKAAEAARERMITDFANKAAEAYSKILTRYPVMDRSDDAKARLLALHQPVPRPTKAALAQNKAEEAGRGERTRLSSAMGALGRHPDVTPATKVGDPTLTDQTPISASGLVQQANRVAMGANSSGSKSVSAVTTGTGTPPENEPAPRSDTTPPETAKSSADQGTPQPDPNESKPGSTDASDPKGATDPKTEASVPDPNELKPDVAPTDQPAPAPAQVNEIQQGANGTAQAPGSGNSASSRDLADDKEVASSKHKKKKGLSKIIPIPKMP